MLGPLAIDPNINDRWVKDLSLGGRNRPRTDLIEWTEIEREVTELNSQNIPRLSLKTVSEIADNF